MARHRNVLGRIRRFRSRCWIIMFSVFLLGVVLLVLHAHGLRAKRELKRDAARLFRTAMGQKTGAYLGKAHAGKRVLVSLPPELYGPQADTESLLRHADVLSGFWKGLGNRLSIVGVVQAKVPAELKARVDAAMDSGDEMAPLSIGPEAWFDVSVMDRLLAPYAGRYDLLVCLACEPVESLGETGHYAVRSDADRPTGLGSLAVWDEDAVGVVLINMNVRQFGRAIARGKVVAAVTYKQCVAELAEEELPIEGDMERTFAMHYVLITPDNVKEYWTYFPKGTF